MLVHLSTNAPPNSPSHLPNHPPTGADADLVQEPLQRVQLVLRREALLLVHEPREGPRLHPRREGGLDLVL